MMFFIFGLLACGNTVDNESLATDKTAAEVTNDLGGSSEGFIDYRGGIVDGGGFAAEPAKALGVVWQRDASCRDTQVIEGCLWIPDYDNFRHSNLNLDEIATEDEVTDSTVYVSDAKQTGLFAFLNLDMQDDSAVRMTVTQTYYGSVVDDTALDAEQEQFIQEYGDTSKEQAYIKAIELYHIHLVEYYFVSLTEPADWGKDDSLAYFGDGYYIASDLYNEREVAVITLQPMKVE